MSTDHKVRLRAPELSDFESYARWTNNKEVWQNLGSGPRFQSGFMASQTGEENGYVKWVKDATQRVFSIETSEGSLIGYCALMDIDSRNRSAELAITIGEPAYWSRGYGAQAINLLLGLAFDGYNLHRVFLTLADFNIRGRRCYEKSGFRMEGVMRGTDFVDGVYYDSLLMSILEGEYRAFKTGEQHKSGS